MPHLHMRGEYEPAFYYPYQLDGSSPHAWGILAIFFRPGIENRFIPTCVGNTRPKRRTRSGGPVHPHVRGEYTRWAAAIMVTGGSSPRAWGILVVARDLGVQRRFIPTCVGNTVTIWHAHTMWAVHPHVRGEYTVTALTYRYVIGSSPRAWGIRRRGGGGLCICRFIPTCVGNTGMQETAGPPASVHPHVRGEYSSSRGPIEADPGSSPRAWGILSPSASM